MWQASSVRCCVGRTGWPIGRLRASGTEVRMAGRKVNDAGDHLSRETLGNPMSSVVGLVEPHVNADSY